MPRSINRLSPRKVATENKPGMHADGGGLNLRVAEFEKNGVSWVTKSWMFRFKKGGKERRMGLGPLHTVSLAEARDEALRCRKLLRDGIDPIEARKVARTRQAVDSAKSMTFKECTAAYIKAHKAGWRNAKHELQWSRTLETYAYPMFGDLPVSVVDIGLVMKALEPIWSTKTETASRVRGRIESILDWATVRKYREGENPARWKGNLDSLLPARAKVRNVRHHAALPYDQTGAFLVDLRERECIAARGLEFLILTAARTGEVMDAKWNEFDLSQNLWTIPGERMKSDREHRVPLSPDAVTVIKEMQGIKISDYVFPGASPNRPLSNMAFLQLLKRMGRGDLTAHGFRSTFRDWAAERTAYSSEVAEMALAHSVGSRVEAAYSRGDLFEKRQRIMDGWAAFCSVIPADRADAKVVSIM
jgi:integrase